jgi:hypothetical protein
VAVLTAETVTGLTKLPRVSELAMPRVFSVMAGAPQGLGPSGAVWGRASLFISPPPLPRAAASSPQRVILAGGICAE